MYVKNQNRNYQIGIEEKPLHTIPSKANKLFWESKHGWLGQPLALN